MNHRAHISKQVSIPDCAIIRLEAEIQRPLVFEVTVADFACQALITLLLEPRCPLPMLGEEDAQALRNDERLAAQAGEMALATCWSSVGVEIGDGALDSSMNPK